MAWTIQVGLYHTASPYFLGAMATSGLLLLARELRKGGRTRLRACGEFLAIGALAALCLASADRLLTVLEARGTAPQAVAQAVAPFLNAQGYSASAERGLLHVQHPEGLVSIVTSCEKLGLRGIMELWFLWTMFHVLLDGRRTLDLILGGAFVLAAVVAVRFAACMLIYLEHDNILARSTGLDAIAIFNSAVVTTVTLIASGVALDLLRRRMLKKSTVEMPRSVSRRVLAWRFAACSALGTLIGFSGTCDPPGREKGGRVLFDDRFCGVWEPTARLLDTEWYGDFSTYSFSSLAEWLGHWFMVDVNTARAYDDEFLSHYDVLVLKTPVLPVPEAERDAIERFVTAGGGLLLVGDHTNLLGMGTHLNSLCDKHGLRFRYDSVSDAATGGFVDYFGPRVGRSVGALHVDHLQFMTSCSLDLDSTAQPVVVARSCRRDPHDYANSSFFGRGGPHPELAHGATVLAAWAPVGKGRIAAFTDSTVWSSFAVFQFDREKLAADLIGALNREESPLRAPLRIIAFICFGVGLVVLLISARTDAVLPALLGGFLGVWTGAYIADCVHRIAYDLGPARSPISEVSFLWQGGSCAFPPVLGGTGSLPLDRAFDTLLVSCQRLGLVSRVAYTYDRDLLTESTRALFVIAPVDRPPRSALSRIESFVRAGGALIVLDDGRLGGNGSAPDYLKTFGIELRYSRRTGQEGERIHSILSGLTEMHGAPDGGTFVGHRAFGQGHVVYMRDAADFSRVGMRHCFARPGKAARAKYDTVFWLFRDVLRMAVKERRYYGVCE